MLTVILFSTFIGCTNTDNDDARGNADRGLSSYEFTTSSFSTVDKFDRPTNVMLKKKQDKMRYVGVFYWLWMGNNDHQFGVYDNTKLMSTPEGREALFATDNAPGDGAPNASPLTYMHWTNQPLFGYYNSSDPYIIKKHIEMLTMADVDFIFLDTTNYYIYDKNLSQHYQEASQIKGSATAVLDTFLEYNNQGWDIPKVAFYTNSCSGTRTQEIFDAFYSSGKYEEIWFKPNGKPLIIGTTENNGGGSDMPTNDPTKYDNISESLQEYFDVFESQWPTRPATPQGFPWMDWEAPQSYHSVSKAINVSVSQHGNRIIYNRMDKRSSKGYDYKTNSVEEEWQKGKNFENQWQTVFDYEKMGKHIEFVTITGWNEWVVQKNKDPYYIEQPNNPNGMIMVDNFTAEYSRDVEPDKDYYQDSVYLQMVNNIRKLKYEEMTTQKLIWQNFTLTDFNDFGKVVAVYKDLVGDASLRDFYGYDIRSLSKKQGLVGSWYSYDTARNDIAEVGVTKDENNIYFSITTLEDIITDTTVDNWMNILIKTGGSDNFAGYDYIINRSFDGTTSTIERSLGGWYWQQTGSATVKIKGNQMIVTVPKSALGFNGDNVKFEFKVADNVVKPNYFEQDDAEHDILHYYITGDSAPIGRLNYAYGY